MARILQEHGKNMARAWQEHAMVRRTRHDEHGKNVVRPSKGMERPWQMISEAPPATHNQQQKVY
jgi:hypothetical protein